MCLENQRKYEGPSIEVGYVCMDYFDYSISGRIKGYHPLYHSTGIPYELMREYQSENGPGFHFFPDYALACYYERPTRGRSGPKILKAIFLDVHTEGTTLSKTARIANRRILLGEVE